MEIPTKSQLIEDLKDSFQALINWINEQPESHFNEEIVTGKWSIAGHLYHLIKSTKAVTKGFSMPKIGLRTMFGKNNRPERSYDELLKKYESAVTKINGKMKNPYEAEAGRIFERTELLQRFEKELNDFIAALDKWKEADMNVYIMPHPALGKLTIREFVYFTTLHTHHHLNTLKTNYVK